MAYGSTVGPAFSDFTTTQPWPCGVDITEIRVRHGSLIDALQMTYRTIDQQVIYRPWRGGPGGRESIIALSPGERITGVIGTICTQDHQFPGTSVRQLIFLAQKVDGQKVVYGPYGDESRKAFPSACRAFAVNGKINSIFGRVTDYVRPANTLTGLGAIGFYYEDESRASQNTV